MECYRDKIISTSSFGEKMISNWIDQDKPNYPLVYN